MIGGIEGDAYVDHRFLASSDHGAALKLDVHGCWHRQQDHRNKRLWLRRNAYGTVGTTPYTYNGSGNATAYGTRQQDFADQVDVRLFAGDDRIRMPRTMLPPIRGGNDGWFKLKDVVADARSIRAKASVNFINNPKVLIDRVTGMISISGKAGDYRGQCQAVSNDAPAKF